MLSHIIFNLQTHCELSWYDLNASLCNIWAEFSTWKTRFLISLQYGNQIKQNMDDVNCDKMIDRQFKQLQDARN